MSQEANTPGNAPPAAGARTDPPAPGAVPAAVAPVILASAPARPWVPMAVAAGLAGLALLLLNLPGVLRYPDRQAQRATGAAPDDTARVAALEQRNQALREQIQQGRRLLDRNVCVRDGDLFEPRSPVPRDGQRGAAAEPGTPPPGAGPGAPAAARPGAPPGAPASGAPAAGAAAPGAGPPSPEGELKPVRPEDGAGLVPKAPERMPVPPASAPGFEGSLADFLDKATVLVVTQAGGLGSGFFIGNRQIVTNRHVIDNAQTGQVFVTNKLLEGLRTANIVARSERGPAGSPDFAVLEIEAPRVAPPVMSLSGAAARLQRVTAAGFPGIVTASDDKLAALKRGVASAIPDTVFTQGTITVVQNRESGRPIIGHEATISPGNSGGPLVDDCARVVGVNTFGIFDESGKHKVNYALGAASLMQFLRSNNIQFQSSDGACQPPGTQVAAPAAPAPSTPPPAAGPPPGAVPRAPDAGTAAPPPAAPAPAPAAPAERK